MIITPSQNVSEYLEVPYGWDHMSYYDWIVGQNPAYAQHGVYGVPPGQFKIWMPENRVLEFTINIMGSHNQTGLVCLNYGSPPKSFNTDGPYARHSTVLIEDMHDTLFQWTTNGQVIHQVYGEPIKGGQYLFGVLYETPYAVQLRMKLSEVVVPPAPVVIQKCTLKPGTTKFILKTGGRVLKSTTVKANKIVMEF